MNETYQYIRTAIDAVLEKEEVDEAALVPLLKAARNEKIRVELDVVEDANTEGHIQYDHYTVRRTNYFPFEEHGDDFLIPVAGEVHAWICEHPHERERDVTFWLNEEGHYVRGSRYYPPNNVIGGWINQVTDAHTAARRHSLEYHSPEWYKFVRKYYLKGD